MRRQSSHRLPGLRIDFGVLAALALVLRALVPTGYMIAAADGRAQLVLCPAGLHQATPVHGLAAHHMARATHQPAGMAPAAGMAHAADQCPFALAGAPGLTGSAPEPAQPRFVLLQPPVTVAFATVTRSPPPRHQAPRGPPALV